MKISFQCCICPEKHEISIDNPENWSFHYEDLAHETAFCPKHALIEKWTSAQCPGCVGGWTDCPLWQGFAYCERRNLSEVDFELISKGICPKRVNGTLMFDSNKGKLETVHLQEKATNESGLLLVQAIKDYWAEYCEKSPKHSTEVER